MAATSPDPVLRLIAGPNGAGKTTLATRVVAPTTRLRFVNANVIAAQRWPVAQAEHAYEASQVAAEQRQDLIAARTSFITETVFSHPSKLDLILGARAADSRGSGPRPGRVHPGLRQQSRFDAASADRQLRARTTRRHP